MSIAAPGTMRWIERFTLPMARGDTVLDLGCGAGEPIARFLVDRGLQGVGVDYDAHALDLARTRFPRERWVQGDMRTVVLKETFAGVLAWNCLSLMSRAEQDTMAARAAAWLQPGGRLLLNAAPATGRADGDYRSGTHYDDLAPADYSKAIAAHGLIETAHLARDPACGDAGVWLARKV